MIRPAVRCLAVLLLLVPLPAAARVMLSFHSFNGSIMGGRYPHTFIVLEGALDSTGKAVSENYGYTATAVGPVMVGRTVPGKIMVERPKYIHTTNRHFSVPLTDAQYYAVITEVRGWWNDPAHPYDLERRNCIHFVGRIAELVGLRVEIPQNLLRRPKAWLNLVTRLNPRLGAREID
jgi:hypothetical protein